MQRIYRAFINSMRALSYLARYEKAVQQELILFLISLPLAFLISTNWLVFFALTGSVLLLVLVEVLNTAIEAACDAISRDFHKDIQIAKDCGSLAVLIAILIATTTWLYVLFSTFWYEV